jgi:hypothetical protein
MIRRLFDEHGEPWHPDDLEIVRHLGRHDAARHAVEILGWVGYEERRDDVLLRLDPAIALPKALDRALGYALGTHCAMATLDIRLNGLWREESVAVTNLAARLKDTIVEQISLRHTRFGARRLDLGQLWRDRNLCLLEEIQRFSSRSGVVERSQIIAEARTTLNSPVGLLERTESRNPFIHLWINPHNPTFSESQRLKNLGRPFQDQPGDRKYLDWVLECVHLAIGELRPVAHDFHGFIKKPDGTDHSVEYRRILLPYRTKTGGLIVKTSAEVVRRQAA